VHAVLCERALDLSEPKASLAMHSDVMASVQYGESWNLENKVTAGLQQTGEIPEC
jgi:hypothetical protein